MHHEKSKGNYGNSVPTLDKQAGTYLGPDATRFHAHKHFFNDKRRRARVRPGGPLPRFQQISNLNARYVFAKPKHHPRLI